MIFEPAICCPLQADELRREHGKPRIADSNDRLGISAGLIYLRRGAGPNAFLRRADDSKRNGACERGKDKRRSELPEYY
jgi:hypothetical protein